MRQVILGLAVILPAALVAGAEAPKPGAKSEPPGAAVEAKLVAKKETYSLDLGGKTAEEFRKQLKDAETTGAYPPAPKIDLAIELTNTSDQEVRIRVAGTQNVITLDLKGPGAEMVALKGRATPKFVIASKTITLAPGKSESIPLTSLSYGLRNMTHAAPGEYTLRGSYQTAIAPQPKDARDVGNGFGAVLLTTAPLTLKVEAK